jgi:hypothetical protein
MDAAGATLWAGAIAAMAAIGLLRHAWGLPKRSARHNLVAWLLLCGGTLAGAMAAGAWGIAVVGLAATAAAALLLAQAALTTRAGGRVAPERRVHMLPDQGEPRRIGGRLLTFLLTVPLALASALVLIVAVRGVASAAGASEADANVLALMLLPLSWMVLMTMLLMTGRRRIQALLLVIPAALGGVALLMGIGA